MQTYQLTGGLDLRSGVMKVNPGTLQDCLNYEVSGADGYTRIAGFERFDGRFRVAEFTALRLRGTVTGAFVAGDVIVVEGATSYITNVAVGVVDVVQSGTGAVPVSLPVTIANTTGSIVVTACQVLPSPTGRQSTVNAARKALSAAKRPLVQPVPGNPDLPIVGMFWFKNRLYAIRDFPRIWFQSDTDWPFAVNDVVTLPGGAFTVMSVTYASGSRRSGSVMLWPLRDTGEAMAVLPVLGDLLTRHGTVGASFDLGGSPFGLSTLGLFDPGESETVSAIVTAAQESAAPAGDEPVMQRARAAAGLWKATGNGWQTVDLKREVQFSAGTTAFDTFITTYMGPGATPITSAATFPSVATMNGTDCLAAIAAADGTDVALSGGVSDELLATGFDFSAVPDSATILGVEVRIKRNATAGGECSDSIVELTGLDGPSINKASAIAWDVTPAEVSYGGATDTWGNDNLTPAILKATTFGVHLSTRAIDTTPSGGIDSIKVLVTYRRRDATGYVDNGTSRIAVSLVDVQLIGGAWADGDGTGWISLDVPGAGFASMFSVGMKIYDAATAGNVLAMLASDDQPITLPGWSDLQTNKSRYQFLSTNFFGMQDYRAIYGVSGASPAFSYDGTHLSWIRAPLDPGTDLPRHIARHGSSLVLGYYQGAYIVSVVGQPTNFRGEDGAASFEIGDRLTGIMNAIGDALLITSPTKTMVLHGLDPTTYQQDTVSGNRGAIEYTAADAGRLLVTDQLGIAAADATQNYGDLSRTYISMKVESWLKPRLRGESGAAVRDQRVLWAEATRYNNQYRLYFQDGYVLTATVNDTPQYMIQRYFLPGNATTPDQPFPLSAIAGGIDANGSATLFGSFDADGIRGYVFELDHGSTFDGRKIPAYITLNPLSFSDNASLKRFDHMFLLGKAEGFAKLTASHATDFDLPDGTVGLPLTFGPPDAKFGNRGARGGIDMPVEAYELTLRFDSFTDDEGQHTLQAVATDADSRGDSRGHVRG